MKQLQVYFEDSLVGILSQNEDLVLEFSYEDSWQKSPAAFPLSLVMPLAQKTFGNKITLSFFENLLPEGEVRESLERSHQVHEPFEFLKKFGQDCAGAIYRLPARRTSFRRFLRTGNFMSPPKGHRPLTS